MNCAGYKCQQRPSFGLICLLLVVIFVQAQESQGQFFTKSSKSIPRMGRRSLEEPGDFRHALLDALEDEYGSSLLSTLKRARQNKLLSAGQTEFVVKNEQPTDSNIESNGRDERSSQPRPSSARLMANIQHRAPLDANRILQQLALGQSGTFYDGIYTNGHLNGQSVIDNSQELGGRDQSIPD